VPTPIVGAAETVSVTFSGTGVAFAEERKVTDVEYIPGARFVASTDTCTVVGATFEVEVRRSHLAAELLSWIIVTPGVFVPT
jgi:hypothetical protein